VEHAAAFETEYIIPKGAVEIIFNFSGDAPIPARLGNTVYHLPKCFINGFNTAPIQMQLPKRQFFFGIVFQPLAIKKIFKHPAGAFADLTIDLGLLDPAFHSLWHQLAAQNSFERKVIVLLNWVKQYCIQLPPQEKLVNDFLYAVNRRQFSVKELCDHVCYSSRHLSRKIVDATGMNMENFLLYKKYLYAADLVHHTDLPLTAIAYQSGFSDQSHFIRSFKAYTHLTPGEYKRNKSAVKGHLYK
jgi:AraC-like DNA-binding protein